MNRQLLPATMLCLWMTTGCSADSDHAQSVAALHLEQSEQDIIALVKVPAGTYSFLAAGRCGIGEQAISAEAYGDLGISVEKDRYSGLELYFTNNEDEWEIMLEADQDDSELQGNRFRFSGKVPRNYEESSLEPMEVELTCSGL